MRNLMEYPITPEEVIAFAASSVELEKFVAEAGAMGGNDVLLAKVVLSVVKASVIIIKNDIGSSAADLLSEAFRSQHIREPAE